VNDAVSSSGAVDRTLDVSKVGGRLRAERERLGISLRELARRVGVSPSLVSQIELDRVNPSVSTLYALVTELGMTMSDVFGDSPSGEPVIRRLREEDEDGLAERPETRRVINLASGVRWERLTPQSDREVEFLYVVYPVGAASCPEDALMTHGGKEYGYVSSGTLGVRVGSTSTSSGRAARSRSTRPPAPAVGDRGRACRGCLGSRRPSERQPRPRDVIGLPLRSPRRPCPCP
jgi:Predicted transcriptional regulators